ncbi:MAG: redoxin [Burkholderiales bacterium 28-67-8]|nr:MAG: redoxin [Burkholderiales bacterium 28-67-8]
MNRRTWILGGVAAAALAGGAGFASRSRLSGGAGDTPGAEFWALRFEQPGGGELALASLRGAPLLLNFWATWCPPCIREMPLIDEFHRQQQARGWHVVGLAIDSPTPVREFLARRPVSFPIGLAGLDGSELARTLGNPEGSLPFTVVLGRDDRVIERKLGSLKPADLARWASQAGT